MARESDLGCNDTTYRVRTHLGHLLRPGDMALGYDMVRYAASAGIEQNAWLQHQAKGRDRSSTIHVPDIILVQKDYGEKKKKSSAKVNNKKSERRRKHQSQKSKRAEEVGRNIEGADTEGNDSNVDVFSFPTGTESEFTQLSVLEECLSEEEEEYEDEHYEDNDEDFGEGMEVEDDRDLEGLFAHLVDKNNAGEDQINDDTTA